MKQLFPGKTITTVSYGLNPDGELVVLVATSTGEITTIKASSNRIDEPVIVNTKDLAP